MLIYPLHCRLLPPPFKMWLFLDGQGNFDPLRLLWSETPFNRSSTQEFKLILSLPTTASLQRFRVEVKALPHCQSCWQSAELKALSNADDQREWLAANGLHSRFYERRGVGSVSYFKKIMKFANYIICSCIPLAFAEPLCGSAFKISNTVILALLWSSELAWILRRYSSKALSQQQHRGTNVIKESDNETETQESAGKHVHGLFESVFKSPLDRKSVV